MNDDDIQHAFKAYYRGDNSIEVEGIGMGLYIVKENMKALGGNVSVYQNELGGMIFVLEFQKS